MARHLLDREPGPGEHPGAGTASAARFFDFQARLTGPVFNRIFDTPNSGIRAEVQARHRAEPDIQRVTAIDVLRPGSCRSTAATAFRAASRRINYGLNNRLYAKRTTSREIVSVGDLRRPTTPTRPRRSTTRTTRAASTALARSPRTFRRCASHRACSPSDRFQADFSTEFNTTVNTFTTFTASGSYNSRTSRSAAAGAGGASSRSCPTTATRRWRTTTSTPRPRSTTGNHLGGTYRSTTTCTTTTSASSGSWCSTTRSAAASTSSTRPTISAASPPSSCRRTPLQSLVHARRHRHLLELLRRLRRPAGPLASATVRVDTATRP